MNNSDDESDGGKHCLALPVYLAVFYVFYIH